MSWFLILFLCFIIFVCILLYSIHELAYQINLPRLDGKHVVITGGSSGIGKSVAKEAAKLGANVTIIARNQEKLNDAKNEILQSFKSQQNQPKITTLSMDVTQPYEDTEKQIWALEESVGPISLFVNCAGAAECATIENATENNFRKMIDINLIGTVLPTKAIAQRMMSRREGAIVITSSLASMVGIYGLSAYCASKWALRGFAETLQHEMLPHNVTITLCLPPDTDTPGFEEENKDKPLETKLVCASGGLVHPDCVAQKIISDAMRGRFWSTVGFDGNAVTFGSACLSPYTSFYELFVQVALASFMRAVGVVHVNKMSSIILLCHFNREMEKIDKSE